MLLMFINIFFFIINRREDNWDIRKKLEIFASMESQTKMPFFIGHACNFILLNVTITTFV